MPNPKGEIPGDLFAGIKGAPAQSMFSNTFYGCENLTGEIPENLFAGIKGAPAKGMFLGTFYGCTNLAGESAKIGDKYLYEIWPDVTTDEVGLCCQRASGLSDYKNMPPEWK